MQRLFATFPAAGPGVGLVLLRLAVAVPLTAGAMPVAAAQWLPAVVAVGLLAGVVTPVLAAIAVVLHLAALAAAPADAGALAALLCAAALALLGPGAYSIDARLYGRRRVVTPRDTMG